MAGRLSPLLVEGERVIDRVEPAVQSLVFGFERLRVHPFELAFPHGSRLRAADGSVSDPLGPLGRHHVKHECVLSSERGG